MKAQTGCYAGGITPWWSGPGPCIPGLDVTDSAFPTIIDTQPLELVSESKVHGPAIGNKQAANPQGPLLEVALDVPIRSWCVERACPSREVPEEVEEIDREPPLPRGAAPGSHEPLCAEEIGWTLWKRKRPASRWRGSRPPLHQQIAKYT
jgi:hypothetical protein